MAYCLHADRPPHPDHKAGYSTRRKAFMAEETVQRAPLLQLSSRPDWPYSFPRQKFRGMAKTLPSMFPTSTNRGIWSFKLDRVAPSTIALPSTSLAPIGYPRQPWNSSIDPAPGTWAQSELTRLPFKPFSLMDLNSSAQQNGLPVHWQRHVSVTHQAIMSARVESVVGRRKLTFAQTPVARYTGKHPRTPFPPASDARADLDWPAIGENGIRKKMRTHVVVPPEERRCPDVVDKGLEECKFFPFARWLASHLNMLLTIQNGAHEPILSPLEENDAADRIQDVLAGYFPRKCHPEDDLIATVAFLAVWYLKRLFPVGLLRVHDLHQSSAIEVIARVFLLGLTLANKWLDDFSHSNRKWMRFCSLPISSINLVERTALQMLDHNLSITKGEWHAWLVAIKPSTSRFSPRNHGQMTAAAALKGAVWKEKITKSPETGPLRRRHEVDCPGSSHKLRSLLLEDTQHTNPTPYVSCPVTTDSTPSATAIEISSGATAKGEHCRFPRRRNPADLFTLSSRHPIVQ